MAVDVSRIPNNNKFDPVREAILQLQTEIEDTGATIGNGTLTIGTSSPLSGDVTFTANQTGNSTITIGIDDSDYLSLSDTGSQTIAGDIVISGDLTVSGTTVTKLSEEVLIEDAVIVLNSNETQSPTQNAGIEIERGTSTNKTFLWNETSDKWTLGSETLIAGTFEGNVTGDVTGDLTGNADTATNADQVDGLDATDFTLDYVTDNGNSTTNEVTIKNTTYSEFGGGNTDITGLLSGSTFGTWIKGRESGHVVVGLRDNDNNDSFAILSGSGNYTTDSTYDKLLARFEANGNITLGGNTNISSGALKIGGTTAIDSSRNVFANDVTGNDINGTAGNFEDVFLTNASGASLAFRNSVGNTVDTDNLATVSFQGYYDSAFVGASRIQVKANEDFSATARGTVINFDFWDTGSTYNTIASIDSSGLYIGATNVYDNLPDGITYSDTDNRLKIGVSKNVGNTTETAIQPILLADILNDGFIPYIATGGAGSATVNSRVSDSWLKINSDTLELGASDPVAHEVRYARFLWQSGSNDKVSTVYGAKDITASVQYLGGSATAKIEFTGGSGGGRIQFNDEYTFPATDGSSGQVLGTDGAGDLAWVSGAATTSDLQVVTDNGATTDNPITTPKVNFSSDDFIEGTNSTYQNGMLLSSGQDVAVQINSNDAGTDYFYVVSGSSEVVRLKIDSSNGQTYLNGTLGVGTASPNEELDVKAIGFASVSVTTDRNADNDDMGSFAFYGRNGAATPETLLYSRMRGRIVSATANAETSAILFETMNNGTYYIPFEINGLISTFNYRVDAPTMHINSSASLADGTNPDISTGITYSTSKVVTPKLVFLNDAAGDDNYITHTDSNTAYSVNGQSMGAWYEFVGDKLAADTNNSAGIVASGLLTKQIQATDIVASTFSGDGSAITGVNATLLDGINGSEFLRSNADDTATGTITFENGILIGTGTFGTSADRASIVFGEGSPTSNSMYIEYNGEGLSGAANSLYIGTYDTAGDMARFTYGGDIEFTSNNWSVGAGGTLTAVNLVGSSVTVNGEMHADSIDIHPNNLAGNARIRSLMSGGNAGLEFSDSADNLSSGDQYFLLGANDVATGKLEVRFKSSAFTTGWDNEGTLLAEFKGDDSSVNFPQGKVGIGTTDYGTTAAKLLVGSYLSQGSSAVAQFDGFVRVEQHLIIHDPLDNTKAGVLTYNGTNGLYLTSESGAANFGVNVTAATARLEVAGADTVNAFKVTDSGGGDGFKITSHSTQGTYIQAYDASHVQSIMLDARTDSTSRHTYFNGGGNVGIKITNPQTALEIFNTPAATLKTALSIGGGGGVTTGGGNAIFLKTSGNNDLDRYGVKISGERNSVNNGCADFVILQENGSASGLAERLRLKGDTGLLEVSGNAILDTTNANLKIKAGTTGTKGDIQWTFNTDSTVYASAGITYDNRATDGFLIDSGYPITLDAASGYIRFSNNGSEKMRLTTGGQLGLGVTSPASGFKIDVAGLGQFDNCVNVVGVDTGNPSAGSDQIRVSGYGILGNRGTFYVTNPGTVQIGSGSTHAANPTAEFTASAITLRRSTTVLGSLTSTSSIKAQSSSYIDVAANQTDSAEVKIGVSSGSTEGFVMTNNLGAGHIKQNTIIKMLTYTAAGTSVESARFVNDGLSVKKTSNSYALDVNGTIRADGDVIAYSDARVKENVKTIDNALDKVTQLRGVSYNKIGETEEKIGVIAQEIEKVLPQVVQEDAEGMKSVAYGNIVGVLIEAIKEQQKQIDELKSRLDGSTK